MSKQLYFTNEEILQNGRILFETLEKNSIIAEKLDEYGYSAHEIAQGKNLYQAALEQYGNNRKETEEQRIAYLNFKQRMDEVSKTYREHRNKAKLIFKNNEEAKLSLSLNGRSAQSILALINEMAEFYQTLSQKTSLLNALQRVKVTQDIVTRQQSDLELVKELYTLYSQEKNESEQATKNKNKAFTEFDKWVRELYQYAKYALAEEPQFLQIFGKIVP